MKYSLKATLLSALLLPGAGQFWLKHYLSGFIYAFISVFALSVIVVKIIKLSTVIAENINRGALDQGGGLMGLISNSMLEVNTGAINMAFLIYLGIWVISILDAYRVGDIADKKQERLNSSGYHFS